MAMQRGLAARNRDRDSFDDEQALDLVEVPAAVVCALCGRPDCLGCDTLDEPTQASGVVAIVPWEHRTQSLLPRWWSTAQLATLNHRSFFSALPDGEIRAALTFAVLSELVAVTGLVITGLLFALPLVPSLPRLLLSDSIVREVLLEAVLWGVPLLAAIMVGLHALHGVVTDWAAQREGSRRRGRGLRFGLYGCGWDVVTLPLGLVILAFTQGFGSAARALPLGLTAPGQSVRGYLSGVHALPEERARRAARRAARWTGLSVVALFLVASLAAFVSVKLSR
jgi:hypothetical protein